MEFSLALRHQIEQLYSKVFPQPCFLCGGRSEQYPICKSCINDLPLLGSACTRCSLPLYSGTVCGICLQNPPVQTASFSLFRYESYVKNCIAAYKFHNLIAMSQLFSDLILEHLAYDSHRNKTIIPIPLHPHRLRNRGYNQSALLAKQLAHALHLSYLGTGLKRVRNTPSQHALNLNQRKINLKQAFEWQGAVIPNHVVLIDDVMTTGTTLQVAATELKRVGVETIEVWTIARAIGHY